MPPLMMIIVMPIAPIATITVCESTMRRFLSDRYFPVRRSGSRTRDNEHQSEKWRESI